MFHPALFQLFEHLCRISSSIDFLTELIRDASDQLEHLSKSFLWKSFAVLSDRCQLTSSLLQSNEQTFGRLGEYAMIRNKFSQFEFYCQVNAPFHLDGLIIRISNLETRSKTKQSPDQGESRRFTFDLSVSTDRALFESPPWFVPRISDAFLWNQSITHRTTLRSTRSSRCWTHCLRATSDHLCSRSIHANVLQWQYPSMCLSNHQRVIRDSSEWMRIPVGFFAEIKLWEEEVQAGIQLDLLMGRKRIFIRVNRRWATWFDSSFSDRWTDVFEPDDSERRCTTKDKSDYLSLSVGKQWDTHSHLLDILFIEEIDCLKDFTGIDTVRSSSMLKQTDILT